MYLNCQNCGIMTFYQYNFYLCHLFRLHLANLISLINDLLVEHVHVTSNVAWCAFILRRFLGSLSFFTLCFLKIFNLGSGHYIRVEERLWKLVKGINLSARKSIEGGGFSTSLQRVIIQSGEEQNLSLGLYICHYHFKDT